jgi:diguanylate cyclase (GGDEF)-like protein
LSEADLAAERIREAVAEQAVPHAERGPVSFTVSIGAARLQPDEDVSSVMRRADAALYEAKRRGRNQVALSN